MLTALILMGAVPLAIPNSSGAAAPATQAPGMVVTMVTAGNVDPKGVIPTENGVPGAGVSNWDIAFPTGVLQIGLKYEIETLISDNTYTGPCKFRLELTQIQAGKRVVLVKFNWGGGTCSPGITNGRAEAITIPDAPGPATLSGIVEYGDQNNKLSVPMIIR